MTHFKFNALGAALAQKRHERLHQIHKKSPSPAEVSAAASQLELAFEEILPSIEVYQHFDEELREIEWSFYTPSGEFLLQFGFNLQERLFHLYSLHPELFLSREEMPGYLEAIQRRLEKLSPALELVEIPGRGPALQVRENIYKA
ncbi:MAG TPA: hypothetical protein DF383_10445 [Deltaproteobacteria bacterium]|nr:hypothetical protein [Deltaproteobacteria bacterium]